MGELMIQPNTRSESPNIFEVEITQKAIFHYNRELMGLLLRDRTTEKNIIWATNEYEQYGYGYGESDEITVDLAVMRNGNLIYPRIFKTLDTKYDRTRNKAEVFTPSWICNQQNNLVDRQWFGREYIFNTETDQGWKTIPEPVEFARKKGKGWKDYVCAQRMEITCGEAPYLVSRYDTVTGEKILVKDRIGLLDRKLRVVSENCHTEEKWLRFARKAFQSVYGFEFQGDNLLIARINLLSTFVEFFMSKFTKPPADHWLRIIADVITWNIWQMDGLKAVVPLSCRVEHQEQMSLYGVETVVKECPGCQLRDIRRHNGQYCQIIDWSGKRRKRMTYLSLLGGEN